MPESRAGRFHLEIIKVIDYFRAEYDLTYAECICILEEVKHKVVHELINEEQDDEH